MKKVETTMFEPKILCFAAAFALLVCYTTADLDDYQCSGYNEYDASVKGNVSSPFYGQRDYHDGLNCEYRIVSPRGDRIKLTFKDFDVKPPDFLLVYGRTRDELLGYFMGSENPRPLLSIEGENEINLLFQTDFIVGGRGFLLEYESGPDMKLCSYLQCKNRECYKAEQECDGKDDCGDGTDEEECNHPGVIDPDECGVQAIAPKTIYDSSSDRMVGGEVAIPNSWPWQVSLQVFGAEPNAHFCGGSLINNQWVLTATHCVKKRPHPGDIKIVLGAHDKYTKTPYEQVRYSARVIAYPDLEGDKITTYDQKHDIALIKLNAPVTFSKGVQPACLPKKGLRPEPGWICYVTGWGETRGSGGSEALKQMEMIVQSKQQCAYDELNEQSQICVAKPPISPCSGDSGGPLQCKVGGKFFVFGAASKGIGLNFEIALCTGDGALYAASADKIDWIRTIVKEYS